MRKYYNKEEEFLDEFPNVAFAAAKILNDKWKPDFDCNNDIRKDRKYFESINGLKWLIFDGASIHYENGLFSSAQIVLKSSNQIITIKVTSDDDKLIAEKIVDRKAK